MQSMPARTGQAEPLIRRLRAEGVAAGVAEDMVARFSAQQIRDALDVLPARRCSSTAGWLVAAISGGWQLHEEANGLRAARASVQQRRADTRATDARQDQRDRLLAGWAAAISDALTDTQLAAAVQRVTRPVDGLNRHSVPVAASQILGWAITAATSAPDEPLHTALTDALDDHASDSAVDGSTLPEAIPPPPAISEAAADPDVFRRRVSHAIDSLHTAQPSR